MRRRFTRFMYDKNGAFKLRILRHPIFLFVLLLKIIASFIFHDSTAIVAFSSFFNVTVQSGFASAYNHFYNIGSLNIFPYPPLMQILLAIPHFFIYQFSHVNQEFFLILKSFAIKIPILIADTVIFVILTRWLKYRQKQVLLWYWSSPILFFISYIAGFIDALPIALVFAFLYFLFKQRYLYAMVLLGGALAAKFGIVIILPFVFVYLYLQNIVLIRVVGLYTVVCLTFLLINLPYLQTSGFIELAYRAPTQFNFFEFALPVGGGYVLYVVPLALILLFGKSLSLRRMNRDIFLMFLAFSFGILTLLILPAAGWYFWIIPFFVYFYVRHDIHVPLIFFALHGAYFLFFLFAAPTPVFSGIEHSGVVKNVLFTLLQGTLLMNVIWIYRKGIENYKRTKIYYEPYFMGIAGDSGSGKTTLSRLISQVFTEHHTSVLAGDDMHKWERGHEMWNRYTHLDPRANELYDDVQHAEHLKSHKPIFRRHYDHNTGRFTHPKKINSKSIVIFEGLHAFFLSKMRDLHDLKIFVHPEESVRVEWKIKRDSDVRGKTREEVIKQIQDRAIDAESYVRKQLPYADICIRHKTDDKRQILEVRITDTINIRSLLAEMECAEIIFDYSVSEGFQYVVLQDGVDAQVIDKIAYILIPELWDLTARDPEWESGINGLVQLFVVYCVFASLKNKK